MSFFYNKIGDCMKIYVDLVFLLNFFFDSILLLVVNIILKRNISLKRIFLGSFIGGFSVFILFININSLELFLIKILISIIMILITFKYHNIKTFLSNMGYLYMTSIIMGGFIYFLNIQFSYKNNGIVFFHSGLSINFILLLILSPLILNLYVKQIRKLKINFNNYYKVKIFYKDNEYSLTGYLDTGNNLRDPYFKKPIILVEKNIFKNIILDKYIMVPYRSLNNKSILKCIKADYIEIENLKIEKVLIGLSNMKFNIDGVKCILNNELLKEIL